VRACLREMSNGQGFRTYSEKEIAAGLQWLCFLFSWMLFVFYAYQVKRQTCGWEGACSPPPLAAMLLTARAKERGTRGTPFFARTAALVGLAFLPFSF
jgi:hypothetical protein